MSFDINILVNGNRCKQYHHLDKVFIEAKDGSEYSIEIKNNTWKRILAVCSVDGLDIISGKKAEEKNAGYVINGYSSAKFDGFRVSDEKVAKFVFGAKGDSYAADKGNGAEKNVGVIGVRLWDEKVPEVVYRDRHIHHYHNNPWKSYPSYPTIWCDATYSNSVGDTCDSLSMDDSPNTPAGAVVYSANISSKGLTKGGPTLGGGAKARSAAPRSLNMVSTANVESLRGFDMGTNWGEAKESKTVEVQFTRNVVIVANDIYYASR